MKINTILDYNKIPVNKSFNTRLMVTLASEKTKSKKRNPLNLSLVIDRSGSMHGEKLNYVKEAAKLLCNQLSSDDRVSLTTFDDKVHTVFQNSKINSDTQVDSLIDGIYSGGCTNLSGGYLNGITLAEESMKKGYVNRVILLTDGLANSGIVNENEIAQLVRDGLKRGISTTTIGVGENYNEDLLGTMAENGGGSTYFIENSEDAASIFNEELGYLFDLTAQNLKINFSPSMIGLRFDQLNTYKREIDNSFFIGDIYGGQERQLILELNIPSIEKAGEFELGLINITWDDTTGKEIEQREENVKVSTISIEADEFVHVVRNDEVTLQAAYLLVSRAKDESIKIADNRQFKEAANLLEDYAKMLDSLNLNDSRLIKEIDMLRERANKLRTYGSEFYNVKEKKRMYYEKEMMLKSKMASYDKMMDRRID